MVPKSTILHFQSYDKCHSSLKIATEVYNCLQDLGIEQKITSVTCDGANNMKNAFDILDGVDRFWCVAHRLHLTICNGLALWKKFKKDENETNKNGSDFEDSTNTKTQMEENGLENIQDQDENEPIK
ncbi:unnamed protein product, partial [Rotaria sp. Silwood2]